MVVQRRNKVQKPYAIIFFGVYSVTPNSGNSYNARNVNSDGTLSNNNAYNGNNGVRPDCEKRETK